MVKKPSKARVSKPRVPKMPKARQLKLTSNEVVEVKVPVGTQPVVVQESANTVKIVPVPKAKKQSWLKYLFGY